MPGTPLQEFWDSFFAKSVQDYTYREDLLFQYFKAALSKSYKTTYDNLEYTLLSNSKYITIFSPPAADGSITLKVNEFDIEIPITTTDSPEIIAQLIKEKLITESLDVSMCDVAVRYPRLKVSLPDVTSLSISIRGACEIGLDIEVSQTYEGYMNNVVSQDTIELVTLFMYAEEQLKAKAELDRQKQYIGTKDFNRLPEKKAEYENIMNTLRYLDDKIYSFRQEFYRYGKC